MTAVRKEEETKEMGKIIGICISEKRGTAKHEVETAKLVEDWGIEGDAHAGHWHRQVSLLSCKGGGYSARRLRGKPDRGRI